MRDRDELRDSRDRDKEAERRGQGQSRKTEDGVLRAGL